MERQGGGRKPAAFAIAAVALAAAAALLVGALRAEGAVVVTASTTTVSAQSVVIPSTGELRSDPVRRQEVVASTGTTGGTAATGTVVFEYMDDSQVDDCGPGTRCPPPHYTLPAGTKVATCARSKPNDTGCDGFAVQFALSAPAELTRNAFSAPVPIKAVEPGAAGNVPYGAIHGVVDRPHLDHLVLTVLNREPTTGGSDGQTQVVSQADVDASTARARAAVEHEARQALAAKAKAQGLRAAVAGVDVASSADPPAGTASPRTTITLTATARGRGYKAADAAKAAKAAAAANTPSGLFVVPGSVDHDPPAVAGTEVTVAVRALASPVDPERVRRQAAGKRTGSARRALERVYGRGRVQASTSWVRLGWLPWDRARIDVSVRPA